MPLSATSSTPCADVALRSSWSAGTVTVAGALLAAAVTIVVVHGFFPFALTVTVCVPGSTGTGRFQSARSTVAPSRWTTRSGDSTPAPTETTSRGIFFSSVLIATVALICSLEGLPAARAP